MTKAARNRYYLNRESGDMKSGCGVNANINIASIGVGGMDRALPEELFRFPSTG